MNRRSSILAFLIIGGLSASAGAQSVRLADSLLRRGNVDRAESEYYAAVRARPRDPDARFALGRYLASRGALRIGATLIDEAMQFGFDRRTGDVALARIYSELGEYAAAAALPDLPLSAGERARMRWLASHPGRIIAPDSTVLVAFARSSADGYLGALRIRVNGRPLLALVAARGGCGVSISDTSGAVASLHRFPGDAGATPAAAADSVGYGRLAMTNVPVDVERLPSNAQAVVCLGTLLRFAPTFDSRAGLATFRAGGKAPAPAAASLVLPMREVDGQYTVLQGGGWAPVVMPQISSILAARRWTLDTRRGAIEAEP